MSTHNGQVPQAQGHSAFFVDFNTPGIVQRAITTKLGLHCAPTGELFFEEANIPKSALIGKLGQGFKICMTMLNFTRLDSAARAIGVAQSCIEEACKYANEREQFGHPIAQYPMVQEQIARMSVEHEAAKLLVYKAAWQKDQGMNNTLETSMAKYYAAESANSAHRRRSRYSAPTGSPPSTLWRGSSGMPSHTRSSKGPRTSRR